MSEPRIEPSPDWLNAIIEPRDDIPEGEIHFVHDGEVVFRMVNVRVEPQPEPSTHDDAGQPATEG